MIYGRDANLSDRRDRIHRRRRARRAGARRPRRDRARPRQREGARASPSAAAHPVDRQPRRSRVVPSSADAQDGYVHTAYDSRVGPRARRSSRRRSNTIVAAAKRPRTAGADGAGEAVRHLHVGRVGARAVAASRPTEDAPVNPIALTAWRPAHEQFVLDAATDQLRTMVVRPGVVYGGGNGMVGDLFKSASERAGARRRRRQQPLAARLRPRSRRPLRAAGRAARTRRASTTRTTKATSASTTSSAAIKPYLPVQARRAARADRGSADEDGRVRRRAGARSGRAQPARPRARLDADAAFGGRQRRAAARRVAERERSRANSLGSRFTVQRSRFSRIRTVNPEPEP